MTPKLLTTLRTYDGPTLRADVLAEITVAMVALPLSLAIAIASGASPAQGLITAIVAGFLISLFGGSRVQIGGPTGAFIVVVYGVIADHGYDGLILATCMAGVILLIAGGGRAGRLMRLVPEPVINGFTIGIAVIIATSQLKDLLGLPIEEIPAEVFGKVDAMWSARDGVSIAALGIGVATMILIVMLIAAPLAGYMAMPALAGLLLLTAWNMSEPHRWAGFLKERRSDQMLLGLTLVLTVVADLTLAIGVGVAIGLVLRLQRRYAPPSEWEPPDR